MTKDITPKPHETDIRTLIDRYMSGDTTNEEETTLRTWFRLAGDDMPEEWRPLRALFSFVDEERETRACAAEEQSFRPGTAKLCSHRRKGIHQSEGYKRAGGRCLADRVCRRRRSVQRPRPYAITLTTFKQHTLCINYWISYTSLRCLRSGRF